MKKQLVPILLFAAIFCLAFGLTACEFLDSLQLKHNHEHSFTCHNTDDAYLKSEATCTTVALYYYSCSCGEKGTESFVNGKALGHIGGTATCVEQATCTRCGEKYGSLNSSNHNYADGVCTFCGELRTSGLDLTLSADKTYYLVGKGVCSATEVHIPSTYKGKPVVGIAENGFKNGKNITKVVVPSSVTTIGDGAFNGCLNLTDINIPDGVEIIGNSVFCDCWALENVIIPNTVTSIGGSAFKNSGLTNITIPNTVTKIGNSAFCGCGGLTEIAMPSSVETIGDEAFKSCTQIASVTIPNSVTSLGSGAFMGCTALTSVSIGNGVKNIKNNMFYYCTSLASVILPSSVTEIGDSAFSHCSALTTLTIPSSVTALGDYIITGTANLTEIIFDGTVEQWNAINKKLMWDSNSANYTVVCTDGNLPKN